jgi:hypothetical protein
VVRSRSQKRLVLGRLARKRQLLHSLEPSGAQGKKASARCRLRDCAASYHAIVRDRLPPSFAGDKGGEVTIYKRQRSRECLRRANVWPMNYFRSVDLDQGSLAGLAAVAPDLCRELPSRPGQRRKHSPIMLRQHNTQHLLLGSKAAPDFSPRRRGHSPLLMALGELHGRNLASALMRSRVHNRTSDRGGKPVQLAAVVVGIPPRSGARGTGGTLSKNRESQISAKPNRD